MNYCTQHRLCASGADKQTSAFNLYYASVNRLDKFLNRPGKLLSSSGGQALLVPGLALWLIKNFVSLQQDGQAEVILFPRLTQSRFVVCYVQRQLLKLKGNYIMRVFRLLFLFIVFTGLKISFGQKLDKCTHMCRLKDSLDFAYTSNYYSEKLFKINKGQFFLYDENNAYLPDGRYGNLSEEKVQYVDSLPPFKLDFKRSHFNFMQIHLYIP